MSKVVLLVPPAVVSGCIGIVVHILLDIHRADIQIVAMTNGIIFIRIQNDMKNMERLIV